MMQWTSGMRTGDRVTDKKMAEKFEYLFVDMEWNQMPGHRVIEFQKVLMAVAGDGRNQIGFERALKQAGIEYKKNYLHYENYRARKNNALKVHAKCMEGYHKQKLPSTNFYDVVCYIKNHDMGMLKRLDEKSRVEKLLEMLGE